MKIGVLGTGMVGRTLAGRLAELGHDVTIGTRDVAATMAATTSDAMGSPSFAAWAADHPMVRVATMAEALDGCDLVLNATSGAGSIAALRAAGEENLAGRVLIDVSNPLDFSSGMPPTLFVKDTDSLGEQIQREFPRTMVVKALNVVNANLMAQPQQLADGNFSLFLSGNDDEAKKVVTDLLESLGHRDVIDLGDITTARGTEMLLPLWLRLWGSLGTPQFAFKVVR